MSHTEIVIHWPHHAAALMMHRMVLMMTYRMLLIVALMLIVAHAGSAIFYDIEMTHMLEREMSTHLI